MAGQRPASTLVLLGPEVALEHHFEGGGIVHGDGARGDGDEFFIAQLTEGARKGFAAGAEFRSEHPLRAGESNGTTDCVAGMLDQPVEQAGLNILESEIIEHTDEDAQVGSHRAEHAHRQIGPASDEVEKGGFGNQQHRARFDGPGIGGVARG